MRLIPLVIEILIYGALACGGGYLLWFYPAAITSILSSKSLLITLFSTFLIGPIFFTYNRLSIFDKLEHIPKHQRDKINKQTRGARVVMLRLFLASSMVCMLGYISWSAAGSVPLINKAMFLIIPGMATYFIIAIRITILNIIRIEDSREWLSDWQRQEEARKILIDQINKDRQDAPLVTDSHLERYRLINQDKDNPVQHF